jgi:transposase
MDVIHARCAGLDVHKKTVVACVRVAEGAAVRHEVRTFATTTRGLLALAEWLHVEGCTHAVLEATGIYWKPVWAVLASDVLTLVLAHAAAVRNIPGRKSDVKDAEWLADLLAHGLVRSSFVPPAPQQALRELTRTRKQLVREVGAHAQRIHKLLESANVKLASVLSQVVGASGRAILEGLIAGETDPGRLAARLHPRSQHKRAAVMEAVEGCRLQPHQRFLLGQHLRMIAHAEASIVAIEAEIATALEAFRGVITRLVTIPGVSTTTAAVIVAEVGVDMSRFPTAGHLRSWAGLCPRLDESAGKHGSRRIRKGAPWLKPVLVQSAWVAVRIPNSYSRALYHRLARRSGKKQAIVAVAAALLTAIYAMLKSDQDYRDLGPQHLTDTDRRRRAHRLAKQLEHLGYEVTLREAA